MINFSEYSQLVKEVVSINKLEYLDGIIQAINSYKPDMSNAMRRAYERNVEIAIGNDKAAEMLTGNKSHLKLLSDIDRADLDELISKINAFIKSNLTFFKSKESDLKLESTLTTLNVYESLSNFTFSEKKVKDWLEKNSSNYEGKEEITISDANEITDDVMRELKIHNHNQKAILKLVCNFFEV